MFSVLMSIYINERPKNLEECLNSLITQTKIPSEIVIVKDGPLTKDLDIILENYKKNFPYLINIIELESNVGLGIALAHGLKHCKYELVARMDTDDIARNDRFERQLEYFNADKSLDIIGSHIIEFEEDVNNIVGKRTVPLNANEINQFAKRRNPFNHVTVMYKKDIVLSVGNYRKVSGIGYEDYDLWIRLLISGANCKNIDDYLVYVRGGKDMYKRRGNRERLKTALTFRYNMFKLGSCSFSDLVFASSANIVVTIIPNWLRGFIYINFLRSK